MALYYPIQRYKFESNSQRAAVLAILSPGCIIRYKDTNLKAIHNARHHALRLCRLYYPIQRYKFESNSQHAPFVSVLFVVVLSDTKIQIWKQFTTYDANLGYGGGCIIRYKDTNLKAIHNLFAYFLDCPYVVLSDTKIQIWKQFTTVAKKLQNVFRCIIRYKDTNLKAIHNSNRFMHIRRSVVLSDTKIQIWKQFTTHSLDLINMASCIIRYKDTNLKAIHNFCLSF